MKTVERLIAWLTCACGMVWATYVLAAGSDAGLTVPVLLIHWWGGIALLGLVVVWLLIHLVRARSQRGGIGGEVGEPDGQPDNGLKRTRAVVAATAV